MYRSTEILQWSLMQMRGNGVVYEWNKFTCLPTCWTLIVQCWFIVCHHKCLATAYANNENTFTWIRVYSVWVYVIFYLEMLCASSAFRYQRSIGKSNWNMCCLWNVVLTWKHVILNRLSKCFRQGSNDILTEVLAVFTEQMYLVKMYSWYVSIVIVCIFFLVFNENQ